MFHLSGITDNMTAHFDFAMLMHSSKSEKCDTPKKSLAFAILGIWGFAFFAPLPNHVVVGDTWLHLASGRWIAEHHQILRADPFSWTAKGAPWADSEWLSQSIFWKSYQALGLHGVTLFGAFLVSLTTLAVFSLMLKRTDHLPASIAGAISFSLVFIPSCPDRPLLFTFLAFPMLLLLLEGEWRWPVIPLMLLWANLHGGVILGVGALALWATVSVVRSSGDARFHQRKNVWIAIGGIAATFLNPYGAGVYLNSIHSQFDTFTQNHIQEWFPTPLFAYPFYLIVTIPLCMCALTLSIMSKRRFFDTILLGVVALMALKSRRHDPLFAIVAAPYIVEGVFRYWQARSASRERVTAIESETSAYGKTLTAACWMALILVLGARARASLRNPVPTGDTKPSPQALELLKRRPEAPLLNQYEWGGYLVFAFQGRPPVFVDGRAETVYSDHILDDYDSLANAYPGSQDILKRYDIQTILWSNDSLVCQMMIYQPNWERIYRDNQCSIFARKVSKYFSFQ